MAGDNTVTLEGDNIVIRFGGDNFYWIKEQIKTIPNIKFDATRKAWVVPFNDESSFNVIRIIKKLNTRFKAMKSIVEKANKQTITQEAIKSLQNTNYFDFKFVPSFDVTQFTTKPFNHQLVGIEFIQTVGHSLLLDEMGLGKTFVAIYSAVINPDIKNVLVICPNSLKYTWAREIEQFTEKDYVVVDRNTTKKRLKILEGMFKRIKVINRDELSNKPFFTIINYEMFLRLDNVPEYDLIVCDEIQRIKHYKTKTFKHVKQLKAKYRIGLTGTPIVNSLIDIYNIARFINPDKFGDSFWKFANTYLDRDEYGEVEGYKNIGKFKEILNTFSLRRTKNECLDLPAKLFINYNVDLSREQSIKYNEIVNESRVKIAEEKTISCILTSILYLSMIADGVHLFDPNFPLDDSAKIKELDKILEDIIEEHKVIVWTRFTTNNIERLKERYGKYNPVVFYGAVDNLTRDANIQKFQTDPTCRLFIGNPQAGGLGITLTAADTVIFFDKPFSPAMVLQSIDRAHRIGQNKNVTIISLIANDTVDERIEEVLTRKINLSKIILDEENIKSDSLTLKDLLFIFDETYVPENMQDDNSPIEDKEILNIEEAVDGKKGEGTK